MYTASLAALSAAYFMAEKSNIKSPDEDNSNNVSSNNSKTEEYEISDDDWFKICALMLLL